MAGKIPERRRWFTLALLLIAASMGCNFLTVPFMLFGPDPDGERFPPEYAFYNKATQEKHKKEFKLVVLPYHSRSVPVDYNGADLKLANAFVKQLTQKLSDYCERIKIVPIHELEKFNQEHPEWKGLGPMAIAENFHADYVLDMELASLTLMDKQSRQPFLLGNVRVS